MKNRQISPERKMLYHTGQVLGVVGFLLFISVFVTGAMNIGNFSNFEDQMSSAALRSVFGMIMMIVGGSLVSVGARGTAGAGIVLDPEKKRRDLEPWNRATGGMIKDGLDEAGINLGNWFAEKTTDTIEGNEFNNANFGDKLRELHRLYEEGILSKEEYEHKKRETLDQI